MVAFFAIALPIGLALMGVIVARTVHWIWVAAFVLFGAAAIVVGIQDRRSADIGQKKLAATINGLRDSINKLTQPVTTPTVPARDPDSLYQNGNVVGKVIAPRITLSESRIFFEQIENAGNLDKQKNFEYRDYILKFIRADSFIGMLVQPGSVAANVYKHVVCEIVGRLH